MDRARRGTRETRETRDREGGGSPMETEFTPLAGLAGGLLIGLASAGLMLANGRIAGVSGILGGSLRIAAVIGLPLGAALVGLVRPELHGFAISPNAALLGTGGLLAGVGTQLGNGCTSGHGVCGMARGSGRSIVATLTFMATGALTVFVLRHLVGAS